MDRSPLIRELEGSDAAAEIVYPKYVRCSTTPRWKGQVVRHGELVGEGLYITLYINLMYMMYILLKVMYK